RERHGEEGASLDGRARPHATPDFWQTTVACSSRMRRTSSVASGCPCTECPEKGTTSSDCTPSRCALWYVTTPSVAFGPAPAPVTGMIECAEMPGTIGVAA